MIGYLLIAAGGAYFISQRVKSSKAPPAAPPAKPAPVPAAADPLVGRRGASLFGAGGEALQTTLPDGGGTVVTAPGSDVVNPAYSKWPMA
jgi:hypothetical protein